MMFGLIRIISLIASLTLASVSVAQSPATAPAGSTGLCRDGSYWTGATKQGACRGHKGVQDWYGAASSATAATTAPASAVVAPSPTAAPAAPTVSTPAPTPAAPKASGSAPVAAAPGGGAGKVWVNNASHVYHCPTDRWYGKTKAGQYMSESDAIAKGNRADHGKACQQ